MVSCTSTMYTKTLLTSSRSYKPKTLELSFPNAVAAAPILLHFDVSVKVALICYSAFHITKFVNPIQLILTEFNGQCLVNMHIQRYHFRMFDIDPHLRQASWKLNVSSCRHSGDFATKHRSYAYMIPVTSTSDTILRALNLVKLKWLPSVRKRMQIPSDVVCKPPWTTTVKYCIFKTLK